MIQEIRANSTSLTLERKTRSLLLKKERKTLLQTLLMMSKQMKLVSRSFKLT